MPRLADGNNLVKVWPSQIEETTPRPPSPSWASLTRNLNRKIDISADNNPIFCMGNMVFMHKHLRRKMLLSEIASYAQIEVGAPFSMLRFSNFLTFWKPFDHI